MFTQIFIDTLEKNIKEIYKKCKIPKSMIMTMHDKLVYDNSTLRHICNDVLGKDKVRDHCHLYGFRDATHDGCNLNTRFQSFYSCISQFVWL